MALWHRDATKLHPEPLGAKTSSLLALTALLRFGVDLCDDSLVLSQFGLYRI